MNSVDCGENKICTSQERCVVFERGGGMCNRNLDNRKNIKITIIFAKRIFLGAGELMLGDSSANMLQNCVWGEGRTVFFKNLRKIPPPLSNARCM